MTLNQYHNPVSVLLNSQVGPSNFPIALTSIIYLIYVKLTGHNLVIPVTDHVKLWAPSFMSICRSK